LNCNLEALATHTSTVKQIIITDGTECYFCEQVQAPVCNTTLTCPGEQVSLYEHMSHYNLFLMTLI